MENDNYNFKPEHNCPIVDVDGVIADGKQFDLDITLPKDNRNVIYGVVKDCNGDPVRDAVVKLIEIICEGGIEERRPVSAGRPRAGRSHRGSAGKRSRLAP